MNEVLAASGSPEYLGQVGPGMCCTPIAMCNALRYWGLPSPEPSTEAWEVMIEIAACRHGATIHQEKVAEWLGLISCETSLYFLRRGEHLPAMVSCRSPDGGFHSALVIDTREGNRNTAPELLLVNYRYKSGPLLEWIPWDEVAWTDCNQDCATMRWLVPRWIPGRAYEGFFSGCGRKWSEPKSEEDAIEEKLAAEYACEREKRRLVRE